MAKFVSIFNNKGRVGKTTITWSLADALAEKGKRVLLIDFDPQCNLSIAMLGAEKFKGLVGNTHAPSTIRGFLQGYLQNTGPGSVTPENGPHTHANARVVPGDFWLNVYSDSLSVGNDLLTGNGISKFVALRTLERKLADSGDVYDYVLVDLPPSFGGLVRSALYSSDHLIIPCTSDTFSAYCIGLIAQMLPQFIADWETGIGRFKANNYASAEFDAFGRPIFSGWIFSGYDTRAQKMLRADDAHFKSIQAAIDNLVSALQAGVASYNAVSEHKDDGFNLGNIEDMNVLIQNSLWQSVPVSKLDQHRQVATLAGGKAGWSDAQTKLIGDIRTQVYGIADKMIATM